MKKLLIIWLILLMCGSAVFAGWDEKDKLLASDGANDDEFGWSVALSGDYAIIGAWRGNSAYIFKRNGTNWNEQDILAPVVDEDFGVSVAIDGDYAVIGAQKYNSFQGAAYVFKRDAGLETWSKLATLTASDGAGSDRFGNSVAIEGDVVVVGAFGDDSSTGSVYVFVKPGGGWINKTEDAKLTASDAATGDELGRRSVSISADVIVAGAWWEDAMGGNSGSAYVFMKPGGGWSSNTEDGKLTASDGDGGDWFGYSVAIHGDTIAIGAHSDEPSGIQSGSAYVFTKPGGGWTTMTEDAKLTASDGLPYDLFGCSIAVYQDIILVGAFEHEYTVTNTGAVYVFNRPGGGWTTKTEDLKLMASDGASGDAFGYAVSIDGSYALIGAPFDDNVNGNYAGAAYVFDVCEFYLAGDLNVDCRIDFLDFAVMAMNWLIDCDQTPGDPACVPK